MPEKVRWGVLGAAKIAITKVIPGMQRCNFCEVTAIASREEEKGRAAAEKLGIEKSYGSYEELLGDPDIDAIYNPLPNHLHVPWSIRAARAGKHVLCEKPIGLNVEECRTLIDTRGKTRVKIGEAFMVRSHPQWLRVRELAQSGAIGPVRAIMAAFSYFNRDARNIRNNAEWGGGALMDIGCYPIQISRFLLGEEPRRVTAAMERDPEMRVDRLTSAILEYPATHCVFTCSTQMVPYQRFQILGEKGRIEVEVPINTAPDRPTRIFVDETGELFGSGIRMEEFAACDQYTLQGDAFARAILDDTEPPTPLEDSLRNMAVIDGLVASAQTGAWVNVAT